VTNLGFPKRLIFWGAMICISLSFIGLIFNYFRDRELLRRLTREAPATVEKVDVERAVTPDFAKEGTAGVVVTFVYKVDGHSYRNRTWLSVADAVQFTPWGPAKVCYDPEDIGTILSPKLFPATFPCGE